MPAAGSGERLGAAGPKAFVLCAGRPLCEWSLDVLAPSCDRVVLAVPGGYEDGPDRVRGASSRSASVREALRAAPEAAVAVVHDAARPLVTAELLERCLAALEDGKLAGAVAAARVTDTIKEAGPDGRVRVTLDRGRLWGVQTPQVFRAELLRSALEAADDATLAAATDDAALVEAAGGAVQVVEAPRENIKVTTPEDLAFAEAVLLRRLDEGR